MLLKDKVAVISGAAGKRGIGLATARLFAAHGARVAILDLDAAAAAEAARSMGGAHIGLACDVRRQSDCAAAIAATLAQLGRVDVLINNAGISQKLTTMEIERKHWDEVMEVNLRGVLQLSQAVIPHMRARRNGAIACTASVAGQRGGGIFGGPHYAASKAGVMGLAKNMARELAPTASA